MILRRYRPAPPLDEFISLFWYCHGYAPGHRRDRIMPKGTCGLILNLHDDECRVYDREDPARCHVSSGITVVGPSTGYFVIDTAEQYSVIGVEFRPAGALPFVESPSELLGAHVSLEDIWNRAAASDLRIQVLEAATPDAKFRVLEQLLLARLRSQHDVHPAVRFALGRFHAEPGQAAIAAVTDAIGLSSRRFVQVFREHVGLNPKLYCRVRRFRQVLQAIGESRPVEWAAIALGAGYFDQAHFIHDFRAFSGINPGAYLASRSEDGYLNHVPLK